ncbi:MAG: D-amino acid aminotransferase [Nitrospiria bacterium]
MPNIAFINGKWGPISSAKVSIEDRGFQFGDGVYEVIRTYGRAFFGLNEHLARLQASAKAVEIEIPYGMDMLRKIIDLGCKKSNFKDTLIYVQLTRGAAPRGHAFPRKNRSTLVMTFRANKPLPGSMREEGVRVISTEDVRWGRCYVKSLNLLPNVMAREAAKRVGAFEGIFVRDGKVMEGAASNVFAVLGRKVVTPPKGPYILSGITREIVLHLGREQGFQMSEEKIILGDLYAADELFLTGTTVEVLPVIRVDDKPIGAATPGKVTGALYEAFQNHICK